LRTDSGNQGFIPIIYEDNHLLVVVKPVNVPTQEDESGDPDLLTLLKEDLKNRHQKPGNVYLGLVHRLDRPAGGIMVFAKTSKSASRLSEQIRAHQMKKHYFAVIHGLPQLMSGTLQHYLVKDSKTNKVRTATVHDKEAKEARLVYDVVGQHDQFSLVRIKLLTGRPHQIRVQMSSIGCPLFGDQKYGLALNKPGQQMALWSTTMSFNHPTSKEPLTFHAYPPNENPWSLWAESIYHSEEPS
jgi:23S rRNA pseudouridine1911/1915/1917 synthase